VSTNKEQFCGNCGNRRSPGDIRCSRCGSPYNVSGLDLDASTVQLQAPIQTAPKPTQPIWGSGGAPTYYPAMTKIPDRPNRPSSLPLGKIVLGQGIVIILLFIVIIALLLHSFAGGNTPSPGTTSTATSGAEASGNKLLSCGGCDDPVLVTITTITISTTKMVWAITLEDQTGAPFSYTFQVFDLVDSTGGKYQGVLDSPSDNLHATQSQDDSATFSFVPQTRETYKLTVTIIGTDFNNHFYTIQFNPASFTF
jgi:hypothetical protein